MVETAVAISSLFFSVLVALDFFVESSSLVESPFSSFSFVVAFFVLFSSVGVSTLAVSLSLVESLFSSLVDDFFVLFSSVDFDFLSVSFVSSLLVSLVVDLYVLSSSLPVFLVSSPSLVVASILLELSVICGASSSGMLSLFSSSFLSSAMGFMVSSVSPFESSSSFFSSSLAVSLGIVFGGETTNFSSSVAFTSSVSCSSFSSPFSLIVSTGVSSSFFSSCKPASC